MFTAGDNKYLSHSLSLSATKADAAVTALMIWVTTAHSLKCADQSSLNYLVTVNFGIRMKVLGYRYVGCRAGPSAWKVELPGVGINKVQSN